MNGAGMPVGIIGLIAIALFVCSMELSGGGQIL